MRLVIAEKPSVAELISKSLKDNFKFNRSKGHYQGDNHIITWAYGHLVNSKEPEDYEQFGGWNWESIPFYPPNVDLDYIIPNKTDFDQVRARQLNNIKDVYKNNAITEVINACDAEREGELIFWEVYKFLKMKEPVHRLWLQSNEESDVRDAFDNMRGEDFYLPRMDASFARQYADWLLGHNLTVAATVKVDRLLHFGRVQTPTLSLIVKRKLEKENFKPVTYYEIDAEFGGKYKGKWFKDQKGNTKISSEDEAKELQNKILNKTGKVIEKDVKKQSVKPKTLFDLGELQKELNRKFGFTAQKTLDIAQELYDRYKVTSYPRTDSKFLMSSQVPGFKDVLEAISYSEYEKFVDDIISRKIPTNKNFVDDKKVTDHYAIIPTKKKVNWSIFQDDPKGRFSADDLKKTYDIIIKRFLSMFFPDAEYEKTEIVTEVEGETFKTNGRILIDLGWRVIYGDKDDDTEDKKEKEDDGELPPIEKNEENEVTHIDKEAKQTKAPPHYNDSSILVAMETARDYIEDDDVKDDLKSAGAKMELGTAATRANIIENLISRKYVERKGKQLIATDLGVKLIEIAPDNLKSPEVTAVWESKLKQIETGEYKREEFRSDIGAFVQSEIDELRNKTITVVFPKEKSKFEKMGVCPKCGGDILNFGKGVACTTSTKEVACYKFWATVAGKKLSKTHIKELVQKGETGLIDGFKKSDKSGTFPARLRLKSDYTGIEFYNPVITQCPKCNTDVTHRGVYYSCETNKREAPCTSGPTKFGGKNLSDKLIIDIITKGETDYLKFKSKTKTDYEAKITNKNGEFKMEFKPRPEKKPVEVKSTNLTCPECQAPVNIVGKTFRCKTRECKFVAFREMSKKQITEEILKEVLENGTAGPYPDFISSKGKPFPAKLIYNKGSKKVEFDFNK